MWDAWHCSITVSTIKRNSVHRLSLVNPENVPKLAFEKVVEFESIAFCDPGPRPKAITILFVFKSFLLEVEVTKVSWPDLNPDRQVMQPALQSLTESNNYKFYLTH